MWGPLAPDEGGPAEESERLLEALSGHAELVAVVRDEVVAATRAPSGVEVVAASAYGPFGVDLDVYHLANPVRLHAYVHARALARPGIAVLHEPSLAGLYAAICGGERSPLLAEQARLETGLGPGGPRPVAGATARPGPLAALHSPRVAAASLCTVVDSEWAANELAARCRGAAVEVVARMAAAPPAGEVPDGHGMEVLVLAHAAPGEVVAAAVSALATTTGELAGARLVLAGPPGGLAGPAALAAARRAGAASRAGLLEAPASARSLAAALARASLVVALEWPSHGGTSPLVATALRAGTPVVVGDLPQYGGLRPPAVERVPVGDPAAVSAGLGRILARPGLAASLVAARRDAARLGAAHDADAVAARYGDLLGRFARADRQRRRKRAEAPDAGWPPAVNAIASWEATTGLTEAARRAVQALVASGARVALEDYDYRWAPRQAHRLGPALRALPTGRPYDVELCFLNVNELHIMPDRYLRTARHPRHVIASWYWELPELPRYLHEQVARVDEVWAPSEFVAGVFAPLASRPVRVVPCVVEPVRDERLTRADFGMSDSKQCFFFNFDANSTLARKNPFGVIEAFRRAFPARARHDVQLVMKTINLSRLPEAAAALRAEMAEIGGVIVEDDLSAEAMAALTSLCDVYVSLHRGEGFGLGMAEAMYFAKPVVATGYSGNLEFMSAADSCLVGYSMTKVTLGDLRYNPGAEVVYEPGQYWAEPDLDDAATWMRHLHDEPAAAARIGEAGARTIRERCSARVVGARMRELLEGIGPE